MLIYANARLFNNRAAAKHFDSKISNACNATRAISADLTGDAWIAADSKDVSLIAASMTADLTAALTNVVAAKNVLF